MSIKTCVVKGFFEVGGSEGTIFEVGVFGPDCKYLTAKDFIDTVTDMHRKFSTNWNITDVVIG